jgi:defect-in-organelle-trafficking protein DotB
VFDGAASAIVWPDADREDLRWVEEARKSAGGLDSLLTWAFREGASRVAFQTGHPVWVTIHGRNHRVTRRSVDEIDFSHVVNHLYGADGMARLQGGNDFDTAYAIQIDRSTRLRFRLNTTSTRTSRRDGGNIVLRPIADMPPPLAQQHVEQGILDNYRPRQGMVIVSGATGSGKSTLIAAMMVAKLMDPAGNFNIVEGAAPVEFLLERVRGPSSTINQSEIPRDLPTFAAFVRGAMRREPTDIIVGECRDSETMTAAVQAAISGHMLITTIHAEDVALTMQRITSLCSPAERDNLISAVAQSLRLVINQRLVPSADGRRTALREYLVFDASLRGKFLRTSPNEWPALTRQAVEERGQSYRVAIDRALEEGRIAAYDPVGEGRVADGEIEPAAERTAGIVLAADAGLGVDQLRDASGDRVVFDAGEADGGPEGFRDEGKEQAGAHARLQHLAAGEAEPFDGAPDRADNRFWSVVSVLRRALKCRVFCRAGGLSERLADFLPAWADTIGPRQREAVLCEFRGAEAGEADQLFLLFARRCATGVGQDLGEADGGDIVARAGGPAARERTVAVEMEVGAARLRLIVANRIGQLWFVVLGRSGRCWGGFREIDGPADGGGVEQAERVLRGVGHGRSPGMRAPPRDQRWRDRGAADGGIEGGWRAALRRGRGRAVSTRSAAAGCCRSGRV